MTTLHLRAFLFAAVITFFSLAFPTSTLAQVIGVAPAQNALGISADTSIVVTFSEDMAATTIDDTTFAAWGQQSGVHKGAINYNAGLKQATLTPATPFALGEVVSVALTNDIFTSASQRLNKFAWQFTTAANPSTGKFTASTDLATGRTPWSVAAADLDGDLDADLAVASKDNNVVSIFKNLGAGVFSAKVDYTVSRPSVVITADFDNDGDVDLAVTSTFDAAVCILKNNGDGTFQPRQNYNVGTDPRGMAASDLDGDGDLDLAVANLELYSVSILKNNGAGVFQNRQDYQLTGKALTISAADLDNDGDNDLAVSNLDNSKLFVLFNNNDATFQPFQQLTVGGAPHAVVAADFDHDGDVDLGTGNKTNSFSLLKNNGNGTFQASQDYPLQGGGKWAVAADVDGDNDIDVAAANFNTNAVSILKNNGDATFQPYSDYAITKNPYSIFAADLDGDGDVEVMTANPTQNGVSILFNRGTVSSKTSTIDFGSTYIGFPEEESFYFYNETPNGINITDVTSSSAKFSIPGNKNFSLAAGDSAKIDLQYAPATASNDTGTTKIFATGFPTQKVFLRGVGVFPSAIIKVSPSSLSFGNASLNKAADLIFNISNNGVLALNVLNITQANPNFTLLSGTTFTIPPGQTQSLAVRFMPPFLGSQTDTLKIYNDDPNSALVRMPLSASGVATLLPEISTQPVELKFDSVYVGVSANLTLRVYNRGAATLSLTNIVSTDKRFTVTTSTAATLAPDDSHTVNVKFSPNQLGLQEGLLNITSNDANENPLSLRLNGIGKATPAPALSKVTPTSGNRLQALSVGFKGNNFIAGVTNVNVGADIVLNSVTVHGADSLTANITIGVNAAPGGRDFFVMNSGPGGGVSASKTFSVNNPAPVLSQINPAAGNRLQTLTAGFKGANFISGVSTINAGTSFTIKNMTVHRSDSLSASITIAANTVLGGRNFSITNSGPGGGTSSHQIFTVANPAPALTALAPATGIRGQTIDVLFSGTNFISGVTSVNVATGIKVNSITVNSPTSVTANLTIGYNTPTGPANFSVTNAAPGGGISANQIFNVKNPSPGATNLAPAMGNLLQTLNLGFKGANFIQGVSGVNMGPEVTVNSVTVQRLDSLTANVTIGAKALTGTRNVSVFNGEPGGGISGNLQFTINKPVPALTQINPASGNRLQTLDLGCKGNNFIEGVTAVNVGPGILINTLAVHRADSLTVNVTIAENAATGSRNFSVTNGPPGGGVSQPKPFSVNNPIPTLLRLTPASANRLQTLNVGCKGTNFISGVSSVNAGAGVTTNNVIVHRSDSLTANITVAANAVTGPRNFSVTNGGPGGGTSGTQTFSVGNSVPILTSINPASGLRTQTLNVGCKGNNFINGITTVNIGVDININSITIHRVDSLTANLTIANNATTGARPFTVTNSGIGGGTSAGMDFTVIDPTPTLTKINPVSGGRLQTLEVGFKGANFSPSLTSISVGPNITLNNMTIHRPDSLTANITIEPTATPGPRDFVVTNFDPVFSARQTFTVNNPAPSLTKIEPARASRSQQLEVNLTGTNFINKLTVLNAGPGIVINFLIVSSATSITTNLTVLPTATRGEHKISVSNGAPGGGVSGELTFMVLNTEPTKPRLLQPAQNQLVPLAKPFQPLKFLWSRSFDRDFEDTLKYAINVKGGGLDTTFMGIKDTTVAVNILPRLKVATEYAWQVLVSDGEVTLSWPDQLIFKTSNTITAVQERDRLIPSEYRLEQNYPNPFARPDRFTETTFKYQLPKETLVTLKIYDILGQEVITLVDQRQAPGYYQAAWNGRNARGEVAPGGVYFYRLQAGDFSRVMKMTLVR